MSLHPLSASLRLRVKPEQVEQEKAKRLLLSLGAKVWVAGTKRKHGDYQGTMQTPGLPDLPFVFLPKRHSRGGEYHLVVIEMKSPEAYRKARHGRSPEQLEFAALCEMAGIDYICGDFEAVLHWLIQHGYLHKEHVAHHYVP